MLSGGSLGLFQSWLCTSNCTSDCTGATLASETIGECVMVRIVFGGVLIGLAFACSVPDQVSYLQENSVEGIVQHARASGTWQQAGFDQHRTGFNPNEVIIGSHNVATLQPKWSSTIGRRPTRLVVGSGRVYIGTANKTLYAFNAKTGKRRWRTFANSAVTRLGSPAAVYGKVFYISAGNFRTGVPAVFHAVDASTGVELWTAVLGIDARGTPVVAARTIYVASSDGLAVFAADGCDAAVCQPIWEGDLDLDQRFYMPPVVGKDFLLLIGRDANASLNVTLYAFPIAGCGRPTCSPVWTRDIGDFEVETYAYARGRVYLPTFIGVQSVFAADGRLRWTARQAPRARAVAVAEHVVYAATTTDGIFALDERTGRTLWRGLARHSASAVSVSGDVVYVMARPPAKILHFLPLPLAAAKMERCAIHFGALPFCWSGTRASCRRRCTLHWRGPESNGVRASRPFYPLGL